MKWFILNSKLVNSRDGIRIFRFVDFLILD